MFVSFTSIIYGTANNPRTAPPDAYRPFYVVLGIIGLIAGIVMAKKFFDSSQKEIEEKAEQRRQLEQELGQYASLEIQQDSVSFEKYGVLSLNKRNPKFAKAFFIGKDMITPMSYNPEKYIYTSATVGGITTGGIDKVGGNYVQGKQIHSGKYILYYFDVKIRKIQLTDILYKQAQKSTIKKYLNDKKQIVVEKDVDSAVQLAAIMMGGLSADGQILQHDGYPTLEKCQEIVDWICEAEKDADHS